MLLGLACREALARGLCITPLWSLYSAHGPVFRVMLQVDRAGRQEAQRMQECTGFVLHDAASGDSRTVPWPELATAGG